MTTGDLWAINADPERSAQLKPFLIWRYSLMVKLERASSSHIAA